MKDSELKLIEQSAREVAINPEQVQKLIELIQDKLEPDAEEKPPAVKMQFVILVSDPQGFAKGHDFAGWVLQIPEEESPVTITERIHQAAYEYNASKRGRLLPVQTVGEAIESVKPSYLKERDVWAKTKTPVLVVFTDNEIPKVEKLCSGSSNDNATRA